ncbi:hypothetical protein MUN84_09555 [Hymenobacter sp. 5516J-16]|uniref:hypothetical protein n=1 Tax=Hymenobacter sp. 5516J-16 TaxID=2932253 RepID=UPI001FD47332|nr:hypothetical protein [Hymenobacter sp. 5516J-16]UOQ78749.1 hypothetical protein MUN84_09555 [Hymenobacter sp. 5516J-16]
MSIINSESVRGTFEVIDSFAILQRKELYLIGRLKEGVIRAGWYAHISLNSSLTLAIKIERVEHILMKAQEEYSMLVIEAEEDSINFILGLNIGLEPVIISTEGAE